MSRLHLAAFALLVAAATVVSPALAKPKKKPKKPTHTTETVKTEEAPEFDKAAAVSAIDGVDLGKCRATNAEKGEGHVTITFAATGSAQAAAIDKGPWIGTPVAKCMAGKFKKTKVPAFKGGPVTVGKSFRFD